MQFKDKYTLLQLQSEYKKITKKFKDRVPIVIEIKENSTLKLDKFKYLCPHDLSISQFQYIIRQRLSITADKAIFLFVNNTLPCPYKLLSEIHKEEKHESGFLFISLTEESTFGK